MVIINLYWNTKYILCVVKYNYDNLFCIFVKIKILFAQSYKTNSWLHFLRLSSNYVPIKHVAFDTSASNFTIVICVWTLRILSKIGIFWSFRVISRPYLYLTCPTGQVPRNVNVEPWKTIHNTCKNAALQ